MHERAGPDVKLEAVNVNTSTAQVFLFKCCTVMDIYFVMFFI